MVASQLLIRVQALRDTSTYGERTAEQEADADLADLLSDVAAELPELTVLGARVRVARQGRERPTLSELKLRLMWVARPSD